MAWKDISGDSAQDLIYYLLSHEDDIKQDINDFGDLRHIFLDIFEREAGEPKPDYVGCW